MMNPNYSVTIINSIQELEVGMKFNNFRELCEFLCIEYRTHDNAWKKRNSGKLKLFFNYEVKGQKITILEIYPKMKPVPKTISATYHTIGR